MTRKALFYDIDGTISSNYTQEVPKSAIRAIRAAREAGHLTFINTGRTRECVLQEIVDVGFDGICCGCGTQVIYHGESIFRYHLEEDFCKEIEKAVMEADCGAILEGSEFYFVLPDRPFYDNFRDGGALNKDNSMTMHFSWEPGTARFDKFVLFPDEKSDLSGIWKVIEGKMDIIDRKDLYEIVPSGFSKASAIRTVQEKFHVALEDCYVFGDSNNDMSMFQYCPNAIAMGEHDADLDPYTSLVTDTVENDGLLKAMKKLGLIPEEV